MDIFLYILGRYIDWFEHFFDYTRQDQGKQEKNRWLATLINCLMCLSDDLSVFANLLSWTMCFLDVYWLEISV